MESVIIILLFIILVIYFISKYRDDVIYVKSDIDNRIYLVRNLEDKQMAANLLSKIRIRILKLSDYLNKNVEKYQEYRNYIHNLNKKSRSVEILEGIGSDEYTSYSVNKGEQLVFCLRSRKNNKLHDINLLMYVVLHELAHIACPEYGHTELFKKIFYFFVITAVNIKLYRKKDYFISPEEYCGLEISDSIA